MKRSTANLFGVLGFAMAASAAFAQTNTAPVKSTPLSPAATAAVSAVQNVCLPLVEGAQPQKLAASTSLKNDNGEWTLPIENKARIEFTPPDATNPHLCIATIIHQPGEYPQILAAINGWASSQASPLRPGKVQQQSTIDGDLYTTSTWAGQTSKGAESVVLSDEKAPQGRPLLGDFGQTTLFVSVTPA